MADFQNHADQIAKCLISFQYIEEALKQNLYRLNMLVHLLIKKYVHYDLKPNLESINNAAMGRLIELYKNYCNDTDLISDLRKIKGHRDKIAHQGFLMTHDEMNDSQDLELKISELEKIDEFAKGAMEKLVEFGTDIENKLNQIAAEQRTQTSNEESSASD